MNYVVALGFFDLIHKGHISIFNKTVELAKKLSASPAVFTFSNDIYKVLGKKSSPINCFSERVQLISEQGIDKIFSVEGTKEFLSKSGENFLQYLLDNYNPVAFVCGEDYRCGKNAEFGIGEIKNFCDRHNILLEVVPLLNHGEQKIGSRLIKNLLKNGQVDEVSQHLGRYYQIKGLVVDGRKEGRVFGFPTANITPECIYLKEGVYQTEILIDGKDYKAVTNVGNHPTIGDEVYNVESYILDFTGNLYHKEITVKFIRFLRKIYKFKDKETLFTQIEKDVNAVKTGNETTIVGEDK